MRSAMMAERVLSCSRHSRSGGLLDRQRHPAVRTLRVSVPALSQYGRVLVVGDGDFSFSLGLAKAGSVGELTATSLDSRQQVVHLSYLYGSSG